MSFYDLKMKEVLYQVNVMAPHPCSQQLSKPVAWVGMGGDIGGWQGHGPSDAIFRKITNRNQTDTNEMATEETKYQTDFYSAKKYQY